MPILETITPPTSLPVSVEQAKRVWRVDGSEEDDDVLLWLTAAFEKAEAYCGQPFTAQTVRLTFELGEEYRLPQGAGVPTGVTGFFTDLAQLPPVGSSYLTEYIKGSSISRELPLSEALAQTYSVTVTVNPVCPALVKAAVLEMGGEMYKNRESSVNGTISVETKLNWERKLAQYRRLPIAA